MGADPESPPLLGRQFRAQRAASAVCCLRPRAAATLVVLALLTLLLLPASNRTGVHSALTSVGVPLPDALPDRLHDFLDYLNVGADDGSKDLEYHPPPIDVVEDAPSDESMKPYTLHPNGHLIVDPVASFGPTPPSPHPILTLIKRAEALWNHKVARQSKTLKEAASEYRRRYTRNPPKGFEEWWAYAQANRIVLTDEYDQIHRDLEPFWALEPSDMMHRVRVMQDREETFTIAVEDGTVVLSGGQAFLRRAKDLGDLMSRFSTHVPNINLTFTRHDQPACRLEWTHKERMVELAGLGEYFGPSEFIADPGALSNWANGCPPGSPLRDIEVEALAKKPGQDFDLSQHRPHYSTNVSQSRSYIFDHQAAMDICQHPEIMPIHGFTVAPGTTPGPLVPLFTFAKTNIHSDVLVTPLEQYSDTYIGYDPDWSKKEYNKLMWRGSTTGADFAVGQDWKSSQRSRLHFITHKQTGASKVLVAPDADGIQETEIGMALMNSKYMDVSFSGVPVQCDPVTCAIMSKLIDFRPTMGLDESYQYKYVIDVDGNGWSGRFHRLMSMKAMVLKSTLFPEWYSDRIQPWVHYVPVKVDYSDLYDIMTFFRGGPDGKNGHDNLAEKIGTEGKRWAKDHWRKQDMAAYMFRLSLEWSRLLHRDDPEPQDYQDY